MGFRGGSVVKNLPAKQKTRVWPLGQEDPHAGGNGNPLHYSCLGNPMNRGVCELQFVGSQESDTT